MNLRWWLLLGAAAAAAAASTTAAVAATLMVDDAVGSDSGEAITITPPLLQAGVDCYLRTHIVLDKCSKDPRFDLYELQHNRTWSAPRADINCCGPGTLVPRAPEPFAKSIPLAQCERACEQYSSSGCTGIIVSKPYNITPPRPDLCKGIPAQRQCSPEICDLQPGQISRLKPGTYYHNKQITLPPGSAIVGAGINITYIHACGPPLASGCNMTERRGFLMGNNTYVGNFSFSGRENKRSGCPLGGGMIETPGCQGDYCGLHKNPPRGAPLCNPPDRNLQQCVGVSNLTAEYIHLHAWTQDHVAWFPPHVSLGQR
eukprot:COSAG01_NODE_7613_length_3127_cov_1.861625_5_plen_315_part_00